MKFFINPFGWLILLLLLGIMLQLWKKRTAATRVFMLAALWCFIISTHWFPDMLMDTLEDQYPRQFKLSMIDTAARYDILVLGSGDTYDTSLAPTDQLHTSALGRLTEGVRVWNMLPKSRLILSGYNLHPPAQAEVLAASAKALGVDSSLIFIQPKPTNTIEEAKDYKKLYARADRKLIMVTSAYHIPRAMMLFRSQGLDPVPAATFHMHKRPSVGYRLQLPSPENIQKMEKASHEWIGMAYTKWWLLSKEEKANVERRSSK